jgi:hypothetical protein
VRRELEALELPFCERVMSFFEQRSGEVPFDTGGPLSPASGANMSRVSVISPPAPSSRPNPHYSVFMDSGFIRLVRSSARFETKAQITEARLWVGRQMDAFGRTGRGILIDSRLAPPSTDFEHGLEFGELRRETVRGFIRIAVLVQTKLGVLQSHRIAAQDKTGLVVFEHEADAVEFLKAAPLSKRVP